MRLSRLALGVSAGMARRPARVLATACAALALAACGWGISPNSTGARMADDALLTYQVKAALDQAARYVQFDSFHEILPLPENRIVP
ncbi:hypothetical protein ACQCQ7_19540, partial [Ralstonia pseudosolanacearum]